MELLHEKTHPRVEGRGIKVAAYRAPFSRWALVGALSALLVCAAAAEWWSYPATTEIQLSETGGDELAIVVNKSHRLLRNDVSKNQVELPSAVIRNHANQFEYSLSYPKGRKRARRHHAREATSVRATNRDGNAVGSFGHRSNQQSKAGRLNQAASFSVR
jgi:hypothetical protein